MQYQRESERREDDVDELLRVGDDQEREKKETSNKFKGGKKRRRKRKPCSQSRSVTEPRFVTQSRSVTVATQCLDVTTQISRCHVVVTIDSDAQTRSVHFMDHDTQTDKRKKAKSIDKTDEATATPGGTIIHAPTDTSDKTDTQLEHSGDEAQTHRHTESDTDLNDEVELQGTQSLRFQLSRQFFGK